MIYKFPQFNVAIENPTIIVNLNTINDKALDQLLGVDVLLTTDTASFGVRAEDMPYVGTWEDDEVQGMVNNWLVQFEA
jgi:hypothetical protein